MAATTKTVSAAKTTTAAPKTETAASVEASGAIIEDVAKAVVDLTHPAVDSNPRASAPDHANLIDFNDPTISAKEAVAKNLAAAADADVDQAD
jgi:hypothetical protein